MQATQSRKSWLPFSQKRWQRRYWIIPLFSLPLLVVALGGWMWVREKVAQTWPETEGTFVVEGIRAPVTVVRDRYGVPHIFAETAEDLFFAQGYVHAQERFWGMEVDRRRGRGTLSGLLGDQARIDDENWARLDLASHALRELSAMDPQSRAVLRAYAAGVNGWLAGHQTRLPFEYTVLQWRGRPGSAPSPWRPEDSLIVAMVLSWQAGAPQIDPATVTLIKARVGDERAAVLLDTEGTGADRPPSLFPFDYAAILTGTWPSRWALSSSVTWATRAGASDDAPLFGIELATGLELPTPWYVMAWHVDGEGAAGASTPGLPGLVVGTDPAPVWEQWSDPRDALLSLSEELAPSGARLPWQRWLRTALLSRGQERQLDAQTEDHNLERLQNRLIDTFSPRAAHLVPLLLQVDPEGWRQERVTGMLHDWDFRIGDNNRESQFFVVYQLELARAAFADELGHRLFAAYVAQGDRYQAALDRILADPADPWWDDVGTPEREERHDMLKQAYEPALEWIGRNYGDLHMLWEWDMVHGSRLYHVLGDAWPWDQLLSRDLNPDGWADTRQASPGGLGCVGGLCMGGDFYRAKAVYGYRQITDAADPETLWFSLLPGQSGHPFHAHYDDLMDGWLGGELVPLYLASGPEDVVAPESTLVLLPME